MKKKNNETRNKNTDKKREKRIDLSRKVISVKSRDFTGQLIDTDGDSAWRERKLQWESQQQKKRERSSPAAKVIPVILVIAKDPMLYGRKDPETKEVSILQQHSYAIIENGQPRASESHQGTQEETIRLAVQKAVSMGMDSKNHVFELRVMK